MPRARNSTVIIQVVPTINTAVYTGSIGAQLGSVTKIPDAVLDPGGSGILTSLFLLDKVNRNANIDFLFFDRLITPVSVDQGALEIADADMKSYFLGRFRISSYRSFVASTESTTVNIGLPIKAADGSRDVYFLMQLFGTSAPDYVAADDLVCNFGIIQS